MAKLETLVDSFTGAAINTGLWNSIVGAATLDTVNDQVSLAVPTASGGTNQFATTSVWDATGSSIFAQVGVPANGNGGTAVGLRISNGVGNNTLIRVTGNTLSAVITTGGTGVSTTLATYDPQAHRWWRISEASGQFLYAVSIDGLNWTTLATLPYTWSATTVTVEFLAAATVTEVAGNVAVLSHLNTRTGGQFNPNWPLLEYGAGLTWGANGGTVPLDGYVDVSRRTMGQTSVNRGRQYELDQVRAGEETATLANTDDAFNPTSASSPFAGRVQPFQPWRVRAQWPPTPNLLTQGVATGGDVSTVSTGTISPSRHLDLLSDTDTTGGTVVATSGAWAGARVAQFAVPTGSTAGARIAHCGQVAAAPGQQYTLQLRVRNVTASTSLQVKPVVGWATTAGSATPTSYTYGTTQTLTGSTTAGWTYLTVTATAPANALGMDVGVAVAATAAATCNVQTDGWQHEPGAVASQWTCPGTWHPVYGGFTEDWQSQWNMSGTYGVVSPPCADAFSLLSQLDLQDPLTMEINSHTPSYLYTLADPQGSTSATDITGTYPALPVLAGKLGAGSVAFGTDITAANPTSGVYTGATSTVATLTNSSPGSATAAAASFLSPGAIGIKGPQSNTYSRMIAFRYTGATPTSQAMVWTAQDNRGGTGSQLSLYIDSAGKLNAYSNGLSAGVLLTSTASVADSNWHLAVISYQFGASGSFALSLDGVTISSPTDQTVKPFGLVSDTIGTFADSTLGNPTRWNYSGDISFVAEFPVALTATDCTNLYTAWRSAAAGESSAARYARILRYAGYTGPSSISTGLTSSMGPANIAGQDVVTALEGVVTTENGLHFVARDGSVTFLGRNARYNAMTPSIIFGENAAAGELPYEDVQTVWDSTHLGNKITVTQDGTGQQFYAQDAASIAAYFPRTITRTVNTSSPLEAQDAADYLLSRYKQPLSRVSTLQLHPGANPAMWQTLLGMELGTRARVMRRPPGVPATQLEVFVENISWSFDDKGDATVTLQCSPADTTRYGIFAAWHTMLSSVASAGSSTLSVVPASGAPLDLVDGTFESGVSGWSANGGTLVSSSLQAHSGRQSGLLTVVGSPTQVTARPDAAHNIAVTANSQYRHAIWVKAPAAIGSALAAIDWFTSAGGYITTSIGTTTSVPAGVWTLLTVTATAPATAAKASAGPTITGSPASGTQLYLDDVTTVPLDNANPLSTQLAAGQQLTLEPGTAAAETVTVQSVGPTAAGWTTATITLTGPTVSAHAANAVVCEPLPAGVTDPTTYDAAAIFDAVAFAY